MSQPQIRVTNGFKKAVALGNKTHAGADSGEWTDAEFLQLMGLWAVLKETGTSQALSHGGMLRTIDEKGIEEFLENVPIDNARLLLKPRQADGTPIADLINYPIWIEPTDMAAEVPDGLPGRLVYDENDLDAPPTVKTWSEWSPGSYKWQTVDGRTLIGSFNRGGQLQKTDTFFTYLQLEEAGDVTLLSTVERKALISNEI